MKWTILGSGGCMVIPKPLCRCRVCREARAKGVPYARAGPSAYLHDVGLLIDTPAEISCLLNRCRIRRVDHLTFTHLDPDHVEGFRVVEQIALDFRTWRAYPEKQICLLLPQELNESLRKLQSQYGPLAGGPGRRGRCPARRHSARLYAMAPAASTPAGTKPTNAHLASALGC